jgi:hypothetical protein
MTITTNLSLTWTDIRLIALCILLALRVATVQAEAGNGGGTRLIIDDISYIGDDKYKITTVLNNMSDKEISLLIYEKNFHIQNDIIGRWTELEDDGVPLKKTISLAPHGSYSQIVLVKIPLSIPNLYVNSDNEVNLQFRHRLDVVMGSDKKQASISDESAYWLKLGTSLWILREGM